MPGTRLNASERDHIAAGLRAGQGYATIARQLERPTSTVSREVARNGGPDTYSPRTAHRAAHQRARRSTADPATSAGADRPSTVDPATAHRFAEDYATMIRRAGIPRMPARVLTQLLVADSGELSARELCERLGVSPGAISKAIRYLEAFSLVRRERPAGQRQELYRFAGDWAATFARREELFAPWEDGARRGADLLGPHSPAGARLTELAQFVQVVRGTIVQIRERWRRNHPIQPRHGSRPAPGREPTTVT